MSESNYHDFERMAMAYILEDDIFPLFVTFVRENGISEEALSWEGTDPGKLELRRQWIRHSPLEAVRALEDSLIPE